MPRSIACADSKPRPGKAGKDDMEIQEFQQQMQALYGEADRKRGIDATVAWLAEELGELAQAVRKGTPAEQLHELGDVLAWIASLANQLELDLESAAQRFKESCPKCSQLPCKCGA